MCLFINTYVIIVRKFQKVLEDLLKGYKLIMVYSILKKYRYIVLTHDIIFSEG